MSAVKHLLIVYHTQTGHTRTMAWAVLRGARRVVEVETRLKMARRAGLDAVLFEGPLQLAEALRCRGVTFNY